MKAKEEEGKYTGESLVPEMLLGCRNRFTALQDACQDALEGALEVLEEAVADGGAPAAGWGVTGEGDM